MRIEDSLAKELCCFKNNKKFNQALVEQIFSYYKPYLIFSKKWMKEFYGDEIMTKILGQGSDLSLEKTLYKIILSKTRNDFPYVQVGAKESKDKIENNFSATFTKNEERTKAKEHFKSLFKKAKEIFIYDKYIGVNSNGKLNEKIGKHCSNFLMSYYPKGH